MYCQHYVCRKGVDPIIERGRGRCGHGRQAGGRHVSQHHSTIPHRRAAAGGVAAQRRGCNLLTPPRVRREAPNPKGGPGGAAPGKFSRLQFVQTRTYAQISLGAPNPSPKYVVRMTIFTREVAIFSHRHRHPGAKKSSKKKQPLLRLPRWSPTLVLTELDDA